jgi:hypothetical protein
MALLLFSNKKNSTIMISFKKKIAILYCCVSAFSAFSQIRIDSDGRSIFGRPTDNPNWNDPTKFCTINTFGLGTDTYRAGSKISFGDIGQAPNNSLNVAIGEYGNGDSDVLDLHGKNGIILSIGGGNPYTVAARMEPWGELKVYGSLTVNGVSVNSDIRLKKNVKYLVSTECLGKLRKLKAISYDYKTEKEDSILKMLDSKSYEEQKEREWLKQSKIDIERKKKGLMNQIGFSAQDVQTILPELVRTDNEDMLAVNYAALTPILVEAIKEQQNIIDAQKAEIENLKKDIAAIKKKLGM